MKIFDISMEISGKMPVYRNKSAKRPSITMTRTLKKGANESKLIIESHTGTHADSFFHMLADGKTIDRISLDKFLGNCIVFDFTKDGEKITMHDFNNMGYKNKIKNGSLVLLKTMKKPLKKFNKNFTYFDKTAAKFLADKKIKLVGIDSLGIERSQPKHETHNILFKNQIPIIEGLDLSKIKPGRYFFIGLPLKIKSGDASPIRAILIQN